ncbi:MAG TPA: GAF domain-containing protein [Ktedonobacterales bacterium]|nr:GAF domain-containing protein [Ktedonobacterales bacterium]
MAHVPGLLGATAAAAYLGLSRTTLHRETVDGKLVPDEVTRGGQRRFAVATLDAYLRQTRGRLAGDALPPLEAQRWESVGKIARLTGSWRSAEEVCRTALPLIYAALPGAEFAYVVIARPPNYDLLEMQRFGYGELEAPMMDVFQALGPRAGYLTPRLIERGERVIFDDMLHDPMLAGSESAIFAQRFGIRSFGAMPLMREGEPIGLLGAGSRTERLFRAADVLYLGAVADVLTTTLAAVTTGAELTQAHSAIGHLAAEGLRLRPVAGPASAPVARDRLRPVIEQYRTQSEAHAVSIQGLGCDIIPAHDALADVMRSATTPGQLELCKPDTEEREEPCTCMAIGVAGPDGAHAAIGAAWHGQRRFSAKERALFTTFASACLLVLAPATSSTG